MNLTIFKNNVIITRDFEGVNMIDLLLGKQYAKIDKKNRVIIPAIYRKIMKTSEFVLVKKQKSDYPVIALFNNVKDYNFGMVEYYDQLPLTDDLIRDYSMNSKIVESDSADRILLSGFEEFEDNIEVVFVGMQRYLEIWKKDDFENYSKKQKSLRK